MCNFCCFFFFFLPLPTYLPDTRFTWWIIIHFCPLSFISKPKKKLSWRRWSSSLLEKNCINFSNYAFITNELVRLQVSDVNNCHNFCYLWALEFLLTLIFIRVDTKRFRINMQVMCLVHFLCSLLLMMMGLMMVMMMMKVMTRHQIHFYGMNSRELTQNIVLSSHFVCNCILLFFFCIFHFMGYTCRQLKLDGICIDWIRRKCPFTC